ncbi:hypothetical protein MNBD_ALPHA03-570 [hydrothermal vent metagenome]|uniref:Methyltransferase type 11 domain-containing protein n=1 Tax=hydrothermal vent metagenome TaxID=652676 RepID=A0A3B1B0D2_9ZZZZ
MNLSSVICPICGAKISNSNNKYHFTCRFCSFKKNPALGTKQNIENYLEKSLKDIGQILALKDIPEIYVDGAREEDLRQIKNDHQVKLIPCAGHIQNADGIWAPMVLPFQDDLSGFFKEKFRQLKPGGMLYLSTPVTRIFQKNLPLPGQINFFKSKNVMFLLEQHGFKMAWRKNRFSRALKIIARRN